MKCAMCRHGETENGTTTMTLEREGVTLVVKAVPAQVCSTCGEVYVAEAGAMRLFQMAEEAVRSGAEVEVIRYRAA